MGLLRKSGLQAGVAAFALAAGLIAAVQAAVPVDVLQRPAVMVREPAHALYLAAARAGQRVVAVGERGTIAVSDDEGQHWRQVPVPVSATLTAVRFASPKVGWATGHYGVVLHTVDAGETWLRQLDGREAARKLLDDARQRVAATPETAASQQAAARHALRDAERLVADGPDKPLLDAYFQDEHTGFVVGAYNLALRTDDGGHSWQPFSALLDNPRGNHLYAITAQGNTLYLAGEQGLLLRSDDGGHRFERVSLPYAGSLFTVVAPTRDSVLVAGLRGNAWWSADRGRTWQRVNGAPPISFIAARAEDGQPPMLLNQAGQLFALQGEQLQPMALPPTPPVTGALHLRADHWLMLTLQGPMSLTAGAAPR